MRISDWSSDVCSSDLGEAAGPDPPAPPGAADQRIDAEDEERAEQSRHDAGKRRLAEEIAERLARQVEGARDMPVGEQRPWQAQYNRHDDDKKDNGPGRTSPAPTLEQGHHGEAEGTEDPPPGRAPGGGRGW